MKELIGTCMNVALLEGKERALQPVVECILVVSEPTYQADMQKVRHPETLRFCTSPRGLLKLSATFGEWAAEAEAIAARHNAAPHGTGGGSHE